MMRYVVFDTETNGLPDVANWPRIVQIAWVIDEWPRQPEACEPVIQCHVIRPEGWVVSEHATAVHGISHEQALTEGCWLPGVLHEVCKAVISVDLVVAHNVAFDLAVLRAELTAAGEQFVSGMAESE